MIDKKKRVIFFFFAILIVILFLNFLLYGTQIFDTKTNVGKVILLEQQKQNQENVFLNNLEEDKNDLIKTSSSSSKKSKTNSNIQLFASEKENSENELITDEKTNRSNDEKTDESEKIFKRGNEEYILREGEEYKLIGIDFSPALPSEICAGDNGKEYIDITVKGEVLIEWDYRWKCVFPGGDNYGIRIKLMESDSLSGDDLINEMTLNIHKECMGTDDFYVSFSYTFKGINLGSQFGGTEDQWTIEVYASVEPIDKKTIKASTKNYDIDKVSCDCVSGACCDLRNKPYKFKSSGSQPTGYEDGYFCSGTNSPTGTSYVKTKDWYCDGKSSSAKSQEFTKDTCGTCKYCNAGSSSCKNYDTSTACGTKKHCDGKGSCINCKSQSSTKCYDSDVYWYDDCNNVEDKKQECGEDICTISWINYCKDDELWKKRDCIDKGCSNSACYSNSYEDTQKVETCTYGCEVVLEGRNAKCKSNPNIACYKNSDCGTSGYSDLYCSGSDVCKWYYNYECINPGTSQSYCTDKGWKVLVFSCEYGCTNAACNSAPSPVEKKPDLTVTDLVVQNINGKTVVLGFTVKNIGEVVANSVYWTIDTGSSDKDPERITPVSLSSGNFTRAFMKWTYLNSGNYYPKVIVDPDNVVKESNENNNEEAISVKV